MHFALPKTFTLNLPEAPVEKSKPAEPTFTVTGKETMFPVLGGMLDQWKELVKEAVPPIDEEARAEFSKNMQEIMTKHEEQLRKGPISIKDIPGLSDLVTEGFQKGYLTPVGIGEIPRDLEVDSK
jgi:hypothetical protein